MFKSKNWLNKLRTDLPQQKPAAPVVVPPTVKPPVEEVVDFEMGIPKVGGIKTKVTTDTTKIVASVAAGAFSAVLGVVVAIIVGGSNGGGGRRY
jgi:hypothetical protein